MADEITSKQPEPPKQPTGLPRLRTYADDLSEEIKKKGATLSSIVGAERERTARELSLEDAAPTEQHQLISRKNLLLALGIVAFVIVGAGAIGTAYYLISNNITAAQREPSIIFPNKILPVAVTSDRSVTDTLAATRNNAVLSLGEVGKLDLTVDGATTTPAEFLALLGAPLQLQQQVTGIMLGIHAFDHNQPFIILQVGQYDRAFAAMLSWEQDIGRSLGNFYRPLNGTVPPTLLFTDKVYENVDIRSSQDAWPIMYAFPRRDILVITTNQATLQEIMTRLNAQVH